MEGSAELIEKIIGDKQSLILALTIGVGFIAGRVARTFLKIAAYAAGFIILIMAGLQYAGLIYVVVNYNFLAEITQTVYQQASQVGVAEHLFFWVPFAASLRKRSLLPMPG